MALKDLLDLNDETTKIGLSEERVRAIIPAARDYISFWREYPDMFVDFLVRGNRTEVKEDEFSFYFYQRVFLRIVFRYQYVYAVYPRAYSKSFISILALMCRCILYPRCKLFVTSGGKEQAASILKEKVQELCTLIPNLAREIDWRRGKTQEGKDYCCYIFKSGSRLDNMAATERTRGQRRTGGLVEEAAGVDGQVLQEVIIPTMAISRRCMDGSTHPEETINKSQVFITTAGYKGTFPYDKLISLLLRIIIQPDRCMIMGGTWRLPVAVGLQSKTFIKDQKDEGTYNEASFAREYESEWTGDSENSFFNSEMFERGRILNQPEYKASGRSSKNSYYVISVDVGRKGCDSVACVFNVIQQPSGMSLKKLVNIFTLTDEHFGDQALQLKKLFYDFGARRIVIDANGVGAGLVDYMVKPTIDPDDDYIYPDFGVYGGNYANAEQDYKKYRTKDCEENAMYLIKANAPLNTEAHTNVQVQLSSGRLKMLIDERVARSKLLNTAKGQQMTPEERNKFLRPFILTSILREEMMNLREETEGINIILKQANKNVRKDKFSSLEYGLLYIKYEDDERKKKKKFNAKDWMFFN